MKTTTLTFYGGIGEIGGNKILLDDSGTRVLLDFGMSFAQRKKFFSDPFLSPRSEEVLLRTGLLPRDFVGKSIYKNGEDFVGALSGKKERPGIDFVLLSHHHVDHAQYITFLRPEIPVICSLKTKLILHALYGRQLPPDSFRLFSEGGKKFIPMGCNIGSSFEKDISHLQICDLDGAFKCRKFDVVKNFSVPGWIFYNLEPKGESVEDYYIKPIPVDHSVEGATAWIVNSSAGPIVYTGDFRLGSLTQEFIEEAKKAEPTALICEGTNAGRKYDHPSLPTEETVEREMASVISEANNMVFVDFNYSNIERIKALVRVTQECGRKLAVSLKSAHLLLILSMVDETIPNPSRDEIFIFTRREPHYTWEGNIINNEEVKDKVVYSADIRGAQSDYVACFSYFDLAELVGIDPKPGSCFIISHSEPYDEEGEIEERILLNWIDLYKLKPIRIHASGHATFDELKEVIQEIAPRILIPVHTEHPEEFRGLAERVYDRVELGKPYELV